MSANGFWWPIRKSPTLVYLESARTSAGLYASNLKLQAGPPIAIAFDLEDSLQSQHAGSTLEAGAKALAEGEIKGLQLVQLADAHVVGTIRRRLRDAPDTAPPWRVVITLRGRHEFTVDPAIYADAFVLRVVGAAAKGRRS